MKKIISGILSVVLILAWAKGSYAVETVGVDIHGFVSQGYMKTSDNNYLAGDTESGSFEFNEFGINFSKDLTDKLRIGLQLLARDIGDIGNDDVTLDWALADYHWKDWAGLRVGKIKLPFGFYNEIRDVDTLRTNILLPQSVYNELLRDNIVAIQGVGVYGEIPANVLGSFSYQAQWGTFSVDKDSGPIKYMENLSGGLFSVTDINVDDAYVGSLQWNTPLEGLRVGGSIFNLSFKSDIKTVAAFGSAPIGTDLVMDTDDMTFYVLSAEYTWDNLVLAAEYLNQKAKSLIQNISPETTQESEGYYVSAAYRFTDWLELGTYYSVYYPDNDDKNGDKLKAQGSPDFGAWQKDLALTTRFDINDYWTIKLEGHRVNGTAQVLASENPDGVDEDWYLFAAKLTFNF